MANCSMLMGQLLDQAHRIVQKHSAETFIRDRITNIGKDSAVLLRFFSFLL